MGNHEEYVKYLSTPNNWPLWELMPAERCVATCSIAAVPKRVGPQLRKILMVCPFNHAALSVPDLLNGDPGYGLYGAASLAQIHGSRPSTPARSIKAMRFLMWKRPSGGGRFKLDHASELGTFLRSGSEAGGALQLGFDPAIVGYLWDTRMRSSFSCKSILEWWIT